MGKKRSAEAHERRKNNRLEKQRALVCSGDCAPSEIIKFKGLAKKNLIEKSRSPTEPSKSSSPRPSQASSHNFKPCIQTNDRLFTTYMPNLTGIYPSNEHNTIVTREDLWQERAFKTTKITPLPTFDLIVPQEPASRSVSLYLPNEQLLNIPAFSNDFETSPHTPEIVSTANQYSPHMPEYDINSPIVSFAIGPSSPYSPDLEAVEREIVFTEVTTVRTVEVGASSPTFTFSQDTHNYTAYQAVEYGTCLPKYFHRNKPNIISEYEKRVATRNENKKMKKLSNILKDQREGIMPIKIKMKPVVSERDDRTELKVNRETISDNPRAEEPIEPYLPPAKPEFILPKYQFNIVPAEQPETIDKFTPNHRIKISRYNPKKRLPKSKKPLLPKNQSTKQQSPQQPTKNPQEPTTSHSVPHTNTQDEEAVELELFAQSDELL